MGTFEPGFRPPLGKDGSAEGSVLGGDDGTALGE